MGELRISTEGILNLEKMNSKFVLLNTDVTDIDVCLIKASLTKLDMFKYEKIVFYRIIENILTGEDCKVKTVEFSTNKNVWFTENPDWYKNPKFLEEDTNKRIDVHNMNEIEISTNQHILEECTFIIGKYHKDSMLNKLNKFVYEIKNRGTFLDYTIGYMFCLGSQNISFDPRSYDHSDEGYYDQYAICYNNGMLSNCIFGGSQEYYACREEV